MSKTPNKWNANKAKPIQVAFELEQEIATKIRIEAAKNNITPSDQIRKIIGLEYSKPKRPRLTISLTDEDYKTLGKKYNISADDKLEIKKKVLEDIIKDIK